MAICDSFDREHSDPTSEDSPDPSAAVPEARPLVVVDSLPSSSRCFVGRERELAEVHQAVAAARAGSGGLVMVSGEAGIGKTGLATEIAARARARGLEVHWGRCWEEAGAPAYWPWIEVLRSCLAGRDGGASSAARRGAARVVQIMPDLARSLEDVAPAAPSGAADAARERFAAFDAVVAFLAELAADRPLLFILDDLHAADLGSLRLLHFVARALPGLSLLVVGTYREAELARRRPAARLLGELARHSRALPLRGLGVRDVTRFVELGFDITPTRAIAQALHRATGGNPFFLDEAVRALVAEGRLDSPEDAPATALLSPRAGARAAARPSPDAPGESDAPAKDAPRPAGADAQVFRREAEIWTIVHDGLVTRLRDAKGLRYLAQLLRHPHHAWHVLELVAGERDPRRADEGPRCSPGAAAAQGLRTDTGDDAGPLLDAEAKRAYRRRLAELDQERADARLCNDPGRLARVEQEIDALTDELAAAVGLGGRDRHPASAAERARINVSRAIKTALGRIADSDPALGRHLARTVHTGMLCSYDPDPRALIAWTV